MDLPFGIPYFFGIGSLPLKFGGKIPKNVDFFIMANFRWQNVAVVFLSLYGTRVYMMPIRVYMMPIDNGHHVYPTMIFEL